MNFVQKNQAKVSQASIFLTLNFPTPNKIPWFPQRIKRRV